MTKRKIKGRFKTGELGPNRIRADITRWLEENDWPLEAFMQAMRMNGYCGSISGEKTKRFYLEEGPIDGHSLAQIKAFIEDYPRLSSIDAFAEILSTGAKEMMKAGHEQIVMRLNRIEDQRRDHVARHLEAERAPRARPVKHFMDKETAAALSGLAR